MFSRKLFPLFLVVIVLIHPSSAQKDPVQAACDTFSQVHFWSAEHGSCYVFVKTKTRWRNASNLCKSHGIGRKRSLKGRLAHIYSRSLLNLLGSYVDKSKGWWIGLKVIKVSDSEEPNRGGSWHGMPGARRRKPDISHVLASNQERSGQKCVKVVKNRADADPHWKLENVPCSERHYVICEYYAYTVEKPEEAHVGMFKAVSEPPDAGNCQKLCLTGNYEPSRDKIKTYVCVGTFSRCSCIKTETCSTEDQIVTTSTGLMSSARTSTGEDTIYVPSETSTKRVGADSSITTQASSVVPSRKNSFHLECTVYPNDNPGHNYFDYDPFKMYSDQPYTAVVEGPECGWHEGVFMYTLDISVDLMNVQLQAFNENASFTMFHLIENTLGFSGFKSAISDFKLLSSTFEFLNSNSTIETLFTESSVSIHVPLTAAVPEQPGFIANFLISYDD